MRMLRVPWRPAPDIGRWVGPAQQAQSAARLRPLVCVESTLALAGATAAAGVVVLLMASSVGAAWPRPARSAVVLAAALAVLLVGAGVWWATRRLLLSRGAAESHASRWASLPFLPLLALIPIAAEAARSPELAHLLLQPTSTRAALSTYLAAWFIAGELLVVAWWLLAKRRETRGERQGAGVQVLGAQVFRRRIRTREHLNTQHLNAQRPTPDPQRPHFNTSALQHFSTLVLVLALAVYLNSGVLAHPRSWLSEFTQPLFAARDMLAGISPYDPREIIWEHAINLPPVSLVVIYAPLTVIPDVLIRPLFYAANLAGFAAGVWWLLRELALPGSPHLLRLGALVAAMGAFVPWRDSAIMGQPNGLILFLLVATLRCVLSGRPVAGGLALLAATLIKPASGWLILYLLIARQFRLLSVFAGAGALALLISLPVAGVDVWRYYLIDKLPDLLRGTARYGNISLAAVHARLFLTSHALYLTEALPPLPLAAALNRTAALLGVLLLMRLVRPRDTAPEARGVHVLEFGLAVGCALAFAELAWLHYATWLLVAAAALAQPSVWESLPDGRRWLAAAVAGLGFATLALDSQQYLRAVGESLPAWPLLGSLHTFGLLGVLVANALVLSAQPAAGRGPPAGSAALPARPGRRGG